MISATAFGVIGATVGALLASCVFLGLSRVPGADREDMRRMSRDMRYFAAALACAGALWILIDLLRGWGS